MNPHYRVMSEGLKDTDQRDLFRHEGNPTGRSIKTMAGLRGHGRGFGRGIAGAWRQAFLRKIVFPSLSKSAGEGVR